MNRAASWAIALAIIPFMFVADFLLEVRVELATPRKMRRWGEPWRWAVRGVTSFLRSA